MKYLLFCRLCTGYYDTNHLNFCSKHMEGTKIIKYNWFQGKVRLSCKLYCSFNIR